MHRIKEVLNEKGISQKKLAEIMGVEPPAISYIVNGNPTIGKLEEIANALGISVVELIEKKDYSRITCPYCGKHIVIEAKED